MSVFQVLAIIIGGGGVGAIISAVLVYMSSLKENQIDLLDRAYKEIDRQDELVKDLRHEISHLRNENHRLIDEMRKIRHRVEDMEEELNDFRCAQKNSKEEK